MKQIRVGVFETNSSSTHSLTLEGSVRTIEQLKTILESDEDNMLLTWFSEFGWGYEIYEDPNMVLSYLATMLKETELGDLNYDAPQNVVDEAFYASEGFAILNTLAIELGFKGIKLTNNDGYIDHQSYEDYYSLADFLGGQNPLDFLLKGELIIDNDNH